MRRSVHATALLTIAVLVVVSFNGVQISSSHIVSDSLLTGPYVDEVIFRVIHNRDQRILALQNGEIEMDSNFHSPSYLSILKGDPDIEVAETLRNGYGHVTINCDKYPLNISGLRRAFAYAYSKSDIYDGWCLAPYSKMHDSLLPYVNGFCIEDELEWHYYDADIAKGNEILDNLEFRINNATGYRSTPNGESFDIEIEYGASCGVPSVVIQAVEALESLHIDARYRASDFVNFISRLDIHGDYDMVFYAVNFYDDDVDWLAYEYWSENADVDYQNPTNFRNETYDNWRNQLLYGTTYEEVYEASSEMQKILHYNVPRLVVYQNIYFQGYRNDQFTGHVEVLGESISNLWTIRNLHKLDDTFGGTVPIGLGEDPESFNIYTTKSAYSKAILDNLWPSLYKIGPDRNTWPDLATAYIVETHSDHADVPAGHTRFTVDIIQNATWSDGVPLTANDVAFTFIYGLETGNYTDMHDRYLSNLYSLYSPTPYRIVFEFSTESYWHFSKFCFEYIIPQHIFNDENGIGYEGWDYWNPIFDPAEPNINCGPFIFSDFEPGESYTIERNPLFHYQPNPCDTPESTSTTNQTIPQEMNWSIVVLIIAGTGSGVVILFCLVIIMRKR